MINTIISNEYFYFIFLMMLTAVPVGFFAGLFGIGGGLISVPFLFFLFDSVNIDKDYIMHLSVGTSFSITIMTSLSSVMTHRKNKAFDFNIVINYGIFVVMGVLIGTFLTTFLINLATSIIDIFSKPTLKIPVRFFFIKKSYTFIISLICT